MQSTLQHAVSQLATFGIDVEPERCDPGALRADAASIRHGVKPLHLDNLSACPPRFAADLLETVAMILDPIRPHDDAPTVAPALRRFVTIGHIHAPALLVDRLRVEADASLDESPNVRLTHPDGAQSTHISCETIDAMLSDAYARAQDLADGEAIEAASVLLDALSVFLEYNRAVWHAPETDS